MVNLIAKENRLRNYLMQTRLNCLILLFIILTPFASVNSQMSTIDALTAYSASIQKEETAAEGPDETNAEATEQPAKSQDAIIFEDENYGYSGGKTFVDYPQEKFFKKPLSYFGYDFFINQPSTFSPLENMPVPADYILGPKDEIRVMLYGGTSRKWNLTVSREGIIQIPTYGPLSVAGQTFQELKEEIRLIASNQFLNTESSVTLGELRSIGIFVLGEASQPGLFLVSGLSTLTNAIFASGGVNTTGSLRNIQLKRNGEVVSTFDF